MRLVNTKKSDTSEEGHSQALVDSISEADKAILNSLLVALKTRDVETYCHSQRTVSISLLLGRECGLNQEEMRSLELGALLHDIGKIGIPDSVLCKPAKLSDREWEMMRRHPHLGQEILCGLSFLNRARTIVGQHHEKWDGSGYPLGLRGQEIDFAARILLVADAFDAMVSDRAYRAARSYEAAVTELDYCAGSHFDPRIVAAFHRVPGVVWEQSVSRRSLIAVDVAQVDCAAEKSGWKRA